MRNTIGLITLICLLIAGAAYLAWKNAVREPVPVAPPQQAQRAPRVVSVSASGDHTAVRREDGTVWSWGGVSHVQIDGPFEYHGGVPTPHAAVTGASAVFAGPFRLLVLKDDGSLWEADGYLGKPFVQKLAGVSSASAGGQHGAALKTDGTVWTWGENGFGQLGRGMKGDPAAPGVVTDVKGVPLEGIAAVAAGGGHTVALGKDGIVRSWGANGSGQLGIGSRDNQGVPALIDGLADIAAVAGGHAHTLAISRDGTVWAWGANDSGQLGNGDTVQRTRPARIEGLSDVIAIAAGRQHSAALRRDGTVWAWGSNDRGQLGSTEMTVSLTPRQVAGLINIASVACGYDHTAALTPDGTVWVWGDNHGCQLGDGHKAHRTMPVPVTALRVTAGDHADEYSATRYDRPAGGAANAFPANVKAISAGGYHSLALDQAGTVWAWGRNNAGQLGDGTTQGSAVALPVAGLTDVVLIDGGGYHSAAVMKQGVVRTWGSNRYGQLGNGTYQSSSNVVTVTGLDGITAVSAGWAHTVALKRDGTVWAWGNNDQGQLGDGNGAGSAVPVRVSGIDGVSSVSAGRYHTVALKRDGTLWAWGANDAGQFGPGVTGSSPVPVQVKAAGSVFAAAACDHHTLVLTKWNGRVLAWGGNEHGQLGNGAMTPSLPNVGQDAGRMDIRIVAAGSPPPPLEQYEVKRWDRSTISSGAGENSLRSIVAVACGGNHNLALEHNGNAVSWGQGTNGQIGSGGRPWEDSGLALTLTGGVAAMAAGQEHTMVLFSNGTVHVWGSNEFGQLGNGQRDDVWSRTMPVR